MKKIVLLGLLICFNFSFSSAQERVYTLEECIDFALKNNIQLRQTLLQVETGINTLEQSKWTKFPTINGQTGFNTNFGRSIDPFSNDIVTNTIGTNSIGIGANVPIYNGFRIKNTVARNELNVQAANFDVESQKNNISIQVALAYLNMLQAEEQIEISNRQIEVTRLQLDRTQKLVDAGSLPETNLYDLNSQLSSDELAIINAKNNLESAMLTLKQVMSINDNSRIKTQKIILPDPGLSTYPSTINEIYETAISYLPEVKAAELRTQAADLGIDIARSVGLPSITANSSWGTAFSTAAKNYLPSTTTYSDIAASAVFEGETVPFTIKLPQQNFDQTNIPYFNQLGNNKSFNVGIGISIPILNGKNQKFQMQSSSIVKKQTELDHSNTILQIRQAIEQAYINMTNAQKMYSATHDQVKALELSFKAAEIRFNAGSGSSVDYNLAKTNLERAKASLIQAKYDYLFRIKILDFYQNKPLAF